MKQIEATGKKIDDAINAGLKELGVTLSEVNVEILEQGGFFRKAKVRLTVEDDEDLFVKKPVEKEACGAEIRETSERGHASCAHKARNGKARGSRSPRRPRAG